MDLRSSSAFQAISGSKGAARGDLELVTAARAGSGVAFEELQSRYSRQLFRRIRSITRNHEDAEDALQETFLHAHLALRSFEGRSQFASWLTRIAINSALMVLRRRRSRPEVPFELQSDSGEPAAAIDVRDHALNPEQLYDLKHRSDCTIRAISRLSNSLRTPLTAWVERDCTVKELARTLGLSLPTVKARLYRARKQLSCAASYDKRTGNSGSLSGSKRQYAIPELQNRELSCPSCD